MLKIVGSSLIALIALIAGGYFFMKSQKKTELIDEPAITKDLIHESSPMTSATETPREVEKNQAENTDHNLKSKEPKLEDKDPSPHGTTGHFEISIPSSKLTGIGPEDDYADLVDTAREKLIWKILKKNSAQLNQFAKIKSVRCRSKVCTLDASAKTDDSKAFQMVMQDLAKNNPWLGNKIDVTTAMNDPGRGKFIYFQETAK